MKREKGKQAKEEMDKGKQISMKIKKRERYQSIKRDAGRKRQKEHASREREEWKQTKQRVGKGKLLSMKRKR